MRVKISYIWELVNRIIELLIKGQSLPPKHEKHKKINIVVSGFSDFCVSVVYSSLLTSKLLNIKSPVLINEIIRF
jgi:hypothetical protein